MTIPYYVNEHTSDIRAIKPGWYGMESNGKLSSGPFPNQEKCLTGITQARAIFEHRPGWRGHQVSRVWRRARPAVHSR